MDFEALVQHSMDIIAVIDGDTRLVFANAAAKRILGFGGGRGEIGQLMSERVHPEDLAMVNGRLAAITSGDPGGIPISFRVRDVSGNWRVVEVVGSSRLDDPAVSGIVINARDITELRMTVRALERSLERTIETLSSVVEVRDEYTAGHQERVAGLATALATKLGIEPEMAKGIRIAATLHDVGKIAVPAEILTKIGRLTAEEFALIKLHPQTGHDLLREIDFPWPVSRMVLEHHERSDGSGYPHGRMNGQTLLGSRILAVADVIDAMSRPRPYRASRSLTDATAEIRDGAGTRYDAAVADACLELFEHDGFTFDAPTA